MIERIIIENFKSIRKLDLELKPINILVGANGAGKSNFISFFKLVNQIYSDQLHYYIGNNINSFLYFGRKRSTFIYGLIDFDNKYVFDFKVLPNPRSNGGYIESAKFSENTKEEKNKKYSKWRTLRSQIQSQPTSKVNLATELSQTTTTTSSDLYQSPANTYFDNLNIYHFQDAGETSPMKGIVFLSDNRKLNENGNNLASFLYFLREKHPKEFQNIENQIRSVAPFFDRFDLAPDRLSGKQIELLWLEKGSDAYFNAYALSDGTLRFMALTTLLLQPDLPKTLIIDEPELGLHPFAINKLAAMMKQAAAKGNQVIVSTQSVGLIDNFEPEDIIAVDREDNQSVFRRLNSEDLKDWLEDYTLGDLWNKNVIGARP